MFDGSYFLWNQTRIKTIVEYYGHNFFFNKRILDLGCGYGDISGVLHRLGGDITAVDARQEHLKILAKKYNGVKVVHTDLDQPWQFSGRKFDLILDLGLLCHLNNPEEHIKNICASTDFLVLETAVLDSEDPNACIIKPDNKNIYDGSFNGFSAQISAANIERLLTLNGMTFKRLNNTKLNSNPYIYDWHNSNNNSFDLNKRRIWFCIKNSVQINLPSNQLSPNNSTNQIEDSKVPIAPPPIVRSPSPPNTPTPITISPQTKNNNTKPTVGGKIRLFFYFLEDNSNRKPDIDLCLQKNLENRLYDTIVVDAEYTPTFSDIFSKINQIVNDEDISIICNYNTFFDNTVNLTNHIKSNEMYALSRWNWINNNTISFSDTNSQQDAWVIRGKVKNVNGNFTVGKPGSDGRIAYEFQSAGYKVYNPSKSIKAYRLNISSPYSEADRIHGQYLYIDPTSF